jgi:hypothetical protein
MYSQGYRFDFNKMKFLETGGVYVKTNPGDADISIDEKYQNRTSGFSREILIQNLLPKNHSIKIEKAGYHSWEKTLEVKEKNVAKANYIILFPNEINFSSIDTDIKNFYPYPDNSRFVLLTFSNELFSYDSEKKESKKLLNNKQSPYNISDVVFSPSGKRALIKTNAGLHYLLNLEGQTATITLIKNFSSKTENIFFDPNNEASFYYQSNNQIYEVNVDKKTNPTLFKKEKVETFTLSNGYIYSLEDGDVIKTGTVVGTSEKISKEPFQINSAKQYELISMENELFLLENGKTIYLLNKDTKVFDKLFESKTKIEYTPFYDRIIFVADNELYLLLLKDTEAPFFKKAYSTISISKFSKSITDIKWLNGDYFVYALNSKLNISEIDNRDKINSFELDKNASKIFFNGNTKKLFILSQNEFMVSENKVMP